MARQNADVRRLPLTTRPLPPSKQGLIGTEVGLSAVISLIAIFLLHQPSHSRHKIVIGDRVFTFFEMAALELIVGAVTSLLVVAVCALVSRRLSIAMIVVAATVQILWIEFEWGFSVKATDAKE